MKSIIVNSLFTLICLSCSHAFSYSGVFNLNSVFPPDINKYPILFLNYQKLVVVNGVSLVGNSSSGRSEDDSPEKVVGRIQDFINPSCCMITAYPNAAARLALAYRVRTPHLSKDYLFHAKWIFFLKLKSSKKAIQKNQLGFFCEDNRL